MIDEAVPHDLRVEMETSLDRIETSLDRIEVALAERDAQIQTIRTLVDDLVGPVIASVDN